MYLYMLSINKKKNYNDNDENEEQSNNNGNNDDNNNDTVRTLRQTGKGGGGIHDLRKTTLLPDQFR